jgi:hypothetical protein
LSELGEKFLRVEFERDRLQQEIINSTGTLLVLSCLVCHFSSPFILARGLTFKLLNAADCASRAAAERDRAVLKVKDLESKLKDLEERSKAALDAAEAKTRELHAQSVECEGSLTSRLNTLTETLAGKYFDS